MRCAFAALLLLASAPAFAGRAESDAAVAQGEAALARYHPREARVAFLNAIAEDPANPKAHLAQARALIALRQGVAAEAEVTRARETGASRAATGALMADALVLQGLHRRALAEAAKASDRDYAARVAGRAHAALGAYDDAVNAFAEAEALDAKSASLWMDLARFRLQRGDQAGAIAAANRAVGLAPAMPDALTLKGELVRTQYGLMSSLVWFDRALKVDRHDVPAMLERAATLGEIGRTRAMLAATRAVLAIEDRNPRAFFLQATLAARAGHYDAARSLLDRTGGKIDDEPAVMLLSGAVDYALGNVERSIDRLGRLVMIQPDNLKARRLLAAAQWRAGDMVAVVETLRPIAMLSTADSYSLTLIARAQERLGDREGASFSLDRAAMPTPWANPSPADLSEIASLERAVDAEPGAAGPRVMLIRALLRSGRGDAALNNAIWLRQRDPGAPQAHLLVGDALMATGNPRGAAEAYRRAANISFTEPVALRLVDALRRGGQGESAARVLALFAGQNPRNIPARLLLADFMLIAGDDDGAIGLLEDVRQRIGDRDATLLNNLAWAYHRAGDDAVAIIFARRAHALIPANPALADTHGWMLFTGSPERKRGLALIEEAARRAPGDPTVAGHLAEALAELRADKVPRGG